MVGHAAAISAGEWITASGNWVNDRTHGRQFKARFLKTSALTSENPYRLARDIRGIGFKTADDIAKKLGIEKTAMVRVRAGISYALTEAMDMHVAARLQDLTKDFGCQLMVSHIVAATAGIDMAAFSERAVRGREVPLAVRIVGGPEELVA